MEINIQRINELARIDAKLSPPFDRPRFCMVL